MNNHEFLCDIDFFKGFANPYLGVLLTGLFYGMTLCSFSCLPYIGTYILGSQEGFGKGVKATVIFSVSRAVTYTFLGGLCGYIGSVIVEEINPELIFLITGIVIFLIGIIIIIKPLKACSQEHRKISKTIFLQNPYLHLISMGMAISLIPCLPLTAVLLYSSTTHSVFTGGLIALIFGLGTVISPLLFFGGIAGWFSGRIKIEIPQYRTLLQKISGLILVFLGVKLLYETLVINL
ncbi:MAG: sulfite exporter TauE/SafE family protein [Bacteroidota bacterium]